MNRLLPARTKMVPLLVSTLILFAILLVSCSGGGQEGNRDHGNEAASSNSANAKPGDGVTGREASSPAGGSDDKGRKEGERPDQAGQNPVANLPSGESGPSEKSSGGGAGASGSTNPVGGLPPVVTPTPAYYAYCNDQGCPYYFDADGDGIGVGDPVRYEYGTEPPGWVYLSSPDNCPDVYNPNVYDPGAGQYGTGQPDSDADGVGDACDPGTP